MEKGKRKGVTKVLPVWFILLIFLSGCGNNSQNNDTNQPKNIIRLGMANITTAAPYFLSMYKAVEAETEFYSNIILISKDAGGDGDRLTADILDLLAQDVDAIIISAGWIEEAPEALDAIKKKGIPVVLVDRLLKGGNFTSWIGPDNYHIGEQVGEFIADDLKNTGLVVVLRGGPEDNSIGYNRTNGMASIVEKAGIKVVRSKEFGGWNSQGGYTLMKDFLAEYGDRIDYVFGENDSMALGAQLAIIEAGLEHTIKVCGVDGEKAALKKIMEKTNYVATGLNNADYIGRAAFHRIMAILAGLEPQKETHLPSPIITIDNAFKYYNEQSIF